MAKVRIHKNGDVPWATLRSLYPPAMAAELTDAELDSKLCQHEAGLDGSLALSENDYRPNAVFDIHAHDVPEIIYVLEGTLILGNRKIGPGSSVYVSENTLYGFSAGEAGVRTLVFRANGRFKTFSKEGFLEKRLEEQRQVPPGAAGSRSTPVAAV